MTDKDKQLREISMNVRVEIRATGDEVFHWRLASQKDGRTLSNWIRYTLNRAVQESVIE